MPLQKTLISRIKQFSSRPKRMAILLAAAFALCAVAAGGAVAISFYFQTVYLRSAREITLASEYFVELRIGDVPKVPAQKYILRIPEEWYMVEKSDGEILAKLYFAQKEMCTVYEKWLIPAERK